MKHNCQSGPDTEATLEGLDLTVCPRTPASTPEHTMASWRTRGNGEECQVCSLLGSTTQRCVPDRSPKGWIGEPSKSNIDRDKVNEWKAWGIGLLLGVIRASITETWWTFTWGNWFADVYASISEDDGIVIQWWCEMAQECCDIARWCHQKLWDGVIISRGSE